MTVYPTFLAGQRLTASAITSMQPMFITGGTGTNATTTLADASGYTIPAVANASYVGYLVCSYDAPTATDIKFAWTVPAGAGMTRTILGLDVGTASNISSSMEFIRRSAGTAQAMGGPNAVASAFTGYREELLISTAATAGNFQFQFAANAAGTATLNSGFIIIWRTS